MSSVSSVALCDPLRRQWHNDAVTPPDEGTVLGVWLQNRHRAAWRYGKGMAHKHHGGAGTAVPTFLVGNNLPTKIATGNNFK